MCSLNKSKGQIKSIIDQVVCGDAGKNTSWGEMLAEAILTKRHHRIADFVSHGKGFNDSTKKAFCEVLGVKPVYTAKGIDELIAHHCGIELETMLLERKLKKANTIMEIERKKLTESFGNGSEIIAWVGGLLEQGYNSIKTHNGKSFLVNNVGSGFDLKRTKIKSYVQSLVVLNAIQSQLPQS
jgi:hypothetical protein